MTDPGPTLADLSVRSFGQTPSDMATRREVPVFGPSFLDRPGVAFGRYRLLGQVGRGGMAEVHLAADHGSHGLPRACVIKRIAPDFARDRNFLMLFAEEARIAGFLDHPNIVARYDAGEIGGTPYIAF